MVVVVAAVVVVVVVVVVVALTQKRCYKVTEYLGRRQTHEKRDPASPAMKPTAATGSRFSGSSKACLSTCCTGRKAAGSV